MGSRTAPVISALRPEVRAVMAAQLAGLRPGELVAADDLAGPLSSVDADSFERGEVWRWAVRAGLVEPHRIRVMQDVYTHTRVSRDRAAKGRRVPVYVRTARPALPAATDGRSRPERG